MADSEDKKPEKKEGGEGSLNIRIRDQTGEETFFKVKKTTKLDKVFNAYSTRKGVAATSLRFLFDGSTSGSDCRRGSPVAATAGRKTRSPLSIPSLSRS